MHHLECFLAQIYDKNCETWHIVIFLRTKVLDFKQRSLKCREQCTCSRAFSNCWTRSSLSWAGKWRGPTSSSPRRCFAMVILSSCVMKSHKHATTRLTSQTSAYDWVMQRKAWPACAKPIPCYHPALPLNVGSVLSPPHPAVCSVLLNLSVTAQDWPLPNTGRTTHSTFQHVIETKFN